MLCSRAVCGRLAWAEGALSAGSCRNKDPWNWSSQGSQGGLLGGAVKHPPLHYFGKFRCIVFSRSVGSQDSPRVLVSLSVCVCCCGCTGGHLSVEAPGPRRGRGLRSLECACSSTAQDEPAHRLVSSSVTWGCPIASSPATVQIGK